MLDCIKTTSVITLLIALSACASTPTLPDPVLNFTGLNCTDTPDLSKAIEMPGDPKSIKRMMIHRTLVLSETIADDSPCLNVGAAVTIPYALFKLPDNIKNPIVYAGANIDPNSVFAADISVLDNKGKAIKSFERNDYRRQSNLYGVQFAPDPAQTYVLIKANKAMIGDRKTTTETSTKHRWITAIHGSYVSSGADVIGIQQSFERIFSYDGDVSLRIVFPKQTRENKTN